jgi:predicted NodU family carbamoyl transferase
VALTILGLSGALTHDPSAALYIDGKLVAAAEEERFVRDKHAKNRMPYEAAKFCLQFAGIKPSDVDAVAIPFAPISLGEKARWHYAKRYWYAPDRSLDAIFTGNRRYYRYKKRIEWCLLQLGFDLKKVEIVPVEHHLAHASSAYHCSGFKEKTAILGIDGKGEYATTFFGYGENGKIHKIKEFYDPDSLGGLYGALTEFLGFEMLDGEYKVMGMAPYGDPSQVRLLAPGEVRERRTRHQHRLRQRDRHPPLQGKRQGLLLLAEADRLARPDARRRHRRRPVHPLRGKHAEAVRGPVAADDRLLPRRHPARNRKDRLRRRQRAERQAQPEDHRPPGRQGTLRAAGLGRCRHRHRRRGLCLRRARRAGREDGACLSRPVVQQRRRHRRLSRATRRSRSGKNCDGDNEVPQQIAKILADGNPVAWFQGRMEFGPRALGGRSILGCPSVPGVADRINEQIKFRERWRPFCPSMLDTVGPQMLGSDHPAPFMTFTFEVARLEGARSGSRA